MSLALARRDSLPTLGSGQPLPAPVQARMENGFGRDFSAIRVHTGPEAQAATTMLDARAFAAGNDIAFAAGAWAPDSTSGQALLAHELAHSVQQAGVQMKANSAMAAGSNPALEAEADRAAEAVMAGSSPPALTRLEQPLLLRSPSTAPAPSAPEPPGLPATVDGVSLSVKTDTPPGQGTELLELWLDGLTLDNPKGGGKWVQEAYDKAISANPEALAFQPIFAGNRVQAFKEDSTTDEYRDNWVAKYGFSTLKELALALETSTDPTVVSVRTADKDVETLAKTLGGGLSAPGGALKMAVDHIVEKQLGGTSLPENLQLLTSTTNSEAGRKLNQRLVNIVSTVRMNNYRTAKVTRMRLYPRSVKVPTGAHDASAKVEDLLRGGKLKGSAESKTAAGLKPIDLTDSTRTVTVHADDKTRKTVPVAESQRRLVPGMRLESYTRATKGLPDVVVGDLDQKMMDRTKAKDKKIELLAELPPKAPAGDTAAGAAAPSPAAGVGNEVRRLRLKTNDPKGLGFYYPYLSAGTISSLVLDPKSGLSGTGVIVPSVKFLGPLKIKFGPETLALDMTLDHEAVNKSSFMVGAAGHFRFTGGSVSIDLMNFKPEGTLQFTMGPKTKPLIAGEIKVGLDNGQFAASGTLAPASPIPGIKEAAGTVTYRAATGWAGSLKAKSASFAASEVTAELGFTSTSWGLVPKGSGMIRTDVRGKTLDLGLAWEGGAVSYSGKVTVPNPLPMVDSVVLSGSYAGSTLKLTGEAKIKWKDQDAKMVVTYRRVDGEDGNFSGTADVTFKTGKLLGTFNLAFGEKGMTSGGGELTYEVTPQFKPKLSAKRVDGKWKLAGEANLGPFTLLDEWPQKGGKEISIIKGLGVNIPIPLPISPAVTGYAYLRGSLGFRYGLGPAVLKDILFTGSLFPFEQDPQISASATATLEAPFYAQLKGTFGAGLGVSVALDLAGLRGGVDLFANLSLPGKAAFVTTATYNEAEGFIFKAKAGAEMSPQVELGVNLDAAIYAVGGMFEHEWTYPVASMKRPLGPTFKLSIGELVYSRNGLKLPDLSSIEYEPKSFDPLEIVKDVVTGGKKS